MKFIPLTCSRFAMVDDTDYESLSRHKWRAHFDASMDSWYAVRSVTRPNRKEGESRQMLLNMHRVIVGIDEGNRCHVDHINHRTLDNRRENLRIVTCAQNQMNAQKRRDNKSGYPGVRWHEKSQKYHVRMRIDGKEMSLGYFADPAEGPKVYEAKRKERLGLIAEMKEMGHGNQ